MNFYYQLYTCTADWFIITRCDHLGAEASHQNFTFHYFNFLLIYFISFPKNPLIYFKLFSKLERRSRKVQLLKAKHGSDLTSRILVSSPRMSNVAILRESCGGAKNCPGEGSYRNPPGFNGDPRHPRQQYTPPPYLAQKIILSNPPFPARPGRRSWRSTLRLNPPTSCSRPSTSIPSPGARIVRASAHLPSSTEILR